MNLSDIDYPLRWPRDEIADVEGDLHEDNPDFTVERLETAVARIVVAAEMEALASVLEPVSSQAAAFARRRGRVVYPLGHRLGKL